MDREITCQSHVTSIATTTEPYLFVWQTIPQTSSNNEQQNLGFLPMSWYFFQPLGSATPVSPSQSTYSLPPQAPRTRLNQRHLWFVASPLGAAKQLTEVLLAASKKSEGLLSHCQMLQRHYQALQCQHLCMIHMLLSSVRHFLAT